MSGSWFHRPSIGRRRLLGLLTASCLTAPGWAAAQPAAETAAVLGEVVVTARRAEENLQSTPVAVTALGAEALKQTQVADVTDLQRTTPSLTIATGAPSSSGFTFVSLRGQGNLQALVSNDPAVGIYVDGVYIPRPSQGLTDLIDLQRVEVLRGPQGTLFGRNTIGGAVNILTADPADQFEGSARVELGNYDHRAVGLVLNVPFSDQLAARLVLNGKERDGYGDDIPLGRDIWDHRSRFVRGKVRYDGEALDVTLSADYNKIKDNGQFTALRGFAPEIFGPGAPFGPFGLGTVLTNSLHTKANWYDTYATGYFVPNNPLLATLPPDLQALYGRPIGNQLEAYGVGAVITVDLGALTLKSISGYRFSDTDGVIDTDGTPIPILTTLAGYRSKQWSQELQLSGGVGERFQYIAGVYYSRETGVEFSRSQTFGFLPVGPTRPFAGLIGQNMADVKNISTGVFGQGYYDLTEALRLTGGLRWTWDKRNTVLHNFVAAGIPSTCSVARPDAPGVCDQTQRAKFDYPAWTLGLDWQATEDLFVYVQTRGAAKSGGWNTRQGSLPAFRPEKVRDIEGGLKATWLDRRLRTNIAVFHSWQRDVQRNAAALTPSGASTQYVVNAGDARVWGVELEGTAIPWTGMELTANLSLMDGEYKSGSFIEQQTVPGVGLAGCTPTPAGTSSLCPVDRSGEPLPQLPKTQFNLGATQTLATSFGRVVLHADYAYVDHQFFNPVTAAAQQPAVTKALYAAENRLTRVNSYGLLNARLALQLDEPDVEVAVFARNITGKKYVTRTFADVYSAGLGFATDFIGEPSTYGVSLTYRFGGG